MRAVQGLVNVFFCVCLCAGPALAGEQQYPLPEETFKELDSTWAETVKFSQSLSDIIKDETYSIQRESVLFLQKDISSITFSLLTLITMLEMEFIHADQEQFNPNAVAYIERYAASLQEIIGIGIQRNVQFRMVSDDGVLDRLYEKTETFLTRIKGTLEKIQKDLPEVTRDDRETEDFFPEKDMVSVDEGKTGPSRETLPGKDDGKEAERGDDIIPEGSWSITRYNPATGYIQYYTRDGRFVGQKKKE